jgi:hypothetical protein
MSLPARAQPRSKKAFPGGRREYVHVGSGGVPYPACPREKPFLLATAHLFTNSGEAYGL